MIFFRILFRIDKKHIISKSRRLPQKKNPPMGNYWRNKSEQKKCRNCGIAVNVKMSAQQVGCKNGNSHT